MENPEIQTGNGRGCINFNEASSPIKKAEMWVESIAAVTHVCSWNILMALLDLSQGQRHISKENL